MNKLILTTALAGAALAAAPQVAHADECLEVGWKAGGGEWTYYRAWIDEQDGNHIQMHYDYHHGILELKVSQREDADGDHVTVFKGRWYEGRDSQRSGRVRMVLEEGHHRAKGWYTFGDGEDGRRLDFALRECHRDRRD